MMDKSPTGTPGADTQKRLRAFLFALILILCTFVLIEVLPLHFGPRQLPWDQIGPELKTRLPRIIIIGLLAAAFISAPGRKRRPPSPQGDGPDA